MKILDPGHRYTLSYLDNPGGFSGELLFVKRDSPPEAYPGNIGHHEGTNLQEVIRVLIDRVKYLMGQAHRLGDEESISEDEHVLSCLRASLMTLELRAARRHSRVLDFDGFGPNIEDFPVCFECGHIKPETHNHG